MKFDSLLMARWIGLFFVALVVALASPSAPVAAQDAVFPGEAWERIEQPESVGYSSAKLEEAREFIKGLPSTGAMVVVGGRVLFEHGNLTEISYIASVRKSVLSMLYGIEVEKGKIDLSKTLEQLQITDHGGLSDQERQATTDHLLSARSGVYHAASNSGDSLAQAPPRGSQKPGEYFLYSNWDFNALGTIFEQESGRNIYDAVEQELAGPLGMREFQRARHRKSGNLEASMHPAYHMHYSTRDMARIGYLMLRGGVWDGKRILSEDWIKKSTSAITPVEKMNPGGHRRGELGYGYLWWVFDGPRVEPAFEGAYTGIGAGGQFITVIPKLDVVVAHKTNRGRRLDDGGRRSSTSRRDYFTFLKKIAAARTEGAGQR
ncbi:MAG: beta-lactamase family protein [Pirellulales bacterium]|nr:beta-lactamase family protein [Pirellulales bacterium]